MQAPDSRATLRPLGVGEVLDRAVNLCVTYFLPLATIYVVYAIPVGILGYFSSQGLAHVFQAFTDASQAAHGHPTFEQINAALVGAQSNSPLAFLLIGFSLLASPLPAAALIDATTAYYLKRTSSFAQAYRVALDRYFPMLGVSLLYLLGGGFAYFIVIVVAVFLILGLVLVTSAAKAVGIVLSIVLGTAFALALIAFFIVLVLAWQIAYFTCVVERASFTSAFATSLKRTLSGIGIKRSLLIGLIFFAISLIISIVTALGEGLIVGLVHSTVLATIYETIVRILTAAFTTAFIGIFYLDLRVREEGLDLQLQAQQLGTALAAP